MSTISHVCAFHVLSSEDLYPVVVVVAAVRERHQARDLMVTVEMTLGPQNTRTLRDSTL